MRRVGKIDDPAARYKRLLQYLNQHLDIRQGEPPAEVLRTIFADPEERSTMWQMFGVGLGKVSELDHAMFLRDLVQMRQK